MKTDNQLLEDIILKEGTIVNDSETQFVENTNINNAFKSTFSYEDEDVILPGQKVNMPISHDVEMEKQEANEHMIKQLAYDKMAKEKAEYEKMSDDEKIKDYVFKAEYYRQTTDFFNKYHFEMSGKQKRMLTRSIERAWKNGKYKLTEQQRQDILFEMNKASQQMNNNQQENVNNNGANQMANLTNLNSLIVKG